MSLEKRVEDLERQVNASLDVPRSTMTDEEFRAFVLSKLAEADAADEVTPWVHSMRSLAEAFRSGLLSLDDLGG